MPKSNAKTAPLSLERLSRPREITPNVPPFERRLYNDGRRAVAPASPALRAMAQNLIDDCEEHLHLRRARVLLLVEANEAASKRLARGERVTIGRAGRMSPVHRVMSSSPAEEDERRRPPTEEERALDSACCGFDFLVRLSADWLTGVGFLEPAPSAEAVGKALALLDHELLHCGVKIAGEFVEPAKLAAFTAQLDQEHVETCLDVKDSKGRVLVRYRVRRGPTYDWKLRKHDLEEFCGVVARWGAWDRSVGRLIDVLIERERGGATSLYGAEVSSSGNSIKHGSTLAGAARSGGR